MVVYIWNIKFHPFRKREIVENVQRLLNEGRHGIHLTGVNAETTIAAQNNSELRAAINHSDYVNVDSVSVVWGLRLNGIRVPERAATPDIFELFLDEAQRTGQSVYFLGAEQAVLLRAIDSIRQKYPRLTIAGFHNGFYDDESAVVQEIDALTPTYLFIALPTPQKETFILKYKSVLKVGVFYGVGGAFDVLGGKISRGPRWGRSLGLEGLMRMIQRPFNFGVRNIKAYPRFLWPVIRNLGNYTSDA